MSSIPGQGTKISHAERHGQKFKNKILKICVNKERGDVS